MINVLRIPAVVIGSLLVTGPLQQAMADFIPLPLGQVDYDELVSVSGQSPDPDVPFNETATGISRWLPESISISRGSATAYATTLAGSASTGRGPSASASGEGAFVLDGYGSTIVGARAEVSYNISLIKLHPDAPDDILVPLLFTSSSSVLSGLVAQADLSIRHIDSDTTLFFDSNTGGEVNTASSITIPLHDGIEVSAIAWGGDTTGSPADIATASAPVFAIDPDFMVPFLKNPDGTERLENASDLYTVAYPIQIGFSGNFKTVTPLSDGCLPDPSILGPDGTQSVGDSETVTCQAIDPSGYRSYGEGVHNPLGDLNEMDIVITPGAIVRTDDDDTETIGIVGHDNKIFNDGTILSTGDQSDAVFLLGSGHNDVEISSTGAISTRGETSIAVALEGDQNSVLNQGVVTTKGDRSTAVFLEGDQTGVHNEGVITTDGFQSSAIVLEGDSVGIGNERGGDVQTSRDQSSGLVIEGDFGIIQNEGSIGTQGVFSAGIVMLGSSSVATGNTGLITTLGDDAMGILALGQGHPIANLDTEAATGIRNRIWTLGKRAHGIALGLQEAVLPPGVEVPPGALDPASGVINNTGLITTEGDKADAIHALANGLPVTNTGELTTKGLDAHGISIIGTGAAVDNTGQINTSGISAHGVYIEGNDAVINLGDSSDAGHITTSALGAIGIFVIGDRTKVNTSGGTTPATITTEQELGEGILIRGNAAELMSEGNITVNGDNSRGISAFGDHGIFENSGTITAGQDELSSADNEGISIRGSGNTVVNTGIIDIKSAGGVGLFVAGDDATVNNSKSIDAAGDNDEGGDSARGIAITGDRATLTNHADGTITTGSGAAIFIVGNVGTVTNNGTLTSGLDPGASDADGIHVEAAGPDTLSIENTRYIDTFGPESDGISVKASGTSIIDNSGVITTTDNFAEGIELIGVSEYIVSSTGYIATSGDVAHGIDVFRTTLSGNAHITNAGDITVSGPGSVSIRLATQTDDNSIVNNSASGTLTSAALAVSGGLGNEIVRNFGTINGDVSLGAGDDTFLRGPSSTVNGVVDGGQETQQDTLQINVSGSESISGAEFLNFEILSLGGTGALTLEDTLLVTTAEVTAGTTFILEQGSVLDVTTATIEADGTLAGNGTATGTVEVDGGNVVTGSSIGTLIVEGDLLLNSGALSFEADSLTAIDQLIVGGDVVLNEGVIEVILGFTPDSDDVIQVMLIGQTLQMASAFGGIVGIAAANSGVPIGTQFLVGLGSDTFQAIVTANIPVPPAAYLLVSALIGLFPFSRRKTS